MALLHGLDMCFSPKYRRNATRAPLKHSLNLARHSDANPASTSTCKYVQNQDMSEDDSLTAKDMLRSQPSLNCKCGLLLCW